LSKDYIGGFSFDLGNLIDAEKRQFIIDEL